MNHKFKSKRDDNPVYGIGLLGALVYFFQQADGFVEILFGLVKAVLWPAFLVHGLFGLVG